MKGKIRSFVNDKSWLLVMTSWVFLVIMATKDLSDFWGFIGLYLGILSYRFAVAIGNPYVSVKTRELLHDDSMSWRNVLILCGWALLLKVVIPILPTSVASLFPLVSICAIYFVWRECRETDSPLEEGEDILPPPNTHTS